MVSHGNIYAWWYYPPSGQQLLTYRQPSNVRHAWSISPWQIYHILKRSRSTRGVMTLREENLTPRQQECNHHRGSWEKMLKYGDIITGFYPWLDHGSLQPIFKGVQCSCFTFLKAFDTFLCRKMLKQCSSQVYTRHSGKLFRLPHSYPGQNVMTSFHLKGDSVQLSTNLSVFNPVSWHSPLGLEWSLLATQEYCSFPCSFHAARPHFW